MEVLFITRKFEMKPHFTVRTNDVYGLGYLTSDTYPHSSKPLIVIYLILSSGVAKFKGRFQTVYRESARETSGYVGMILIDFFHIH